MNQSRPPRLPEEVLNQIRTLFTAAFSFVAALAWNDAVQSLFRRFFGEASGLVAKFVYAAAVTVVAVVVALKITRRTPTINNGLDS